MAGFFLSYRRDDGAGFAGRLADALEASFGAGSIFRDISDIRPGQDFVAAIDTQLKSSQAILVMIGPRWLERDAEGRRRLDAPDDFVRREVEAGLASGKPVIPLLVGGAAMPDEASLPPSIARFARLQAVALSDVDWRAGIEQLAASLRELRPHSRLRPIPRLVAAAAAAVLGFFAVWHSQSATAGIDVSGRWQANVEYEKGYSVDETFDFKHADHALTGTASFLGTGRTIEQATDEGDSVKFVTRSQVQGRNPGETEERLHRCTGRVTPEGIRFTLEDSSGGIRLRSCEFLARRAGSQP